MTDASSIKHYQGARTATEHLTPRQVRSIRKLFPFVGDMRTAEARKSRTITVVEAAKRFGILKWHLVLIAKRKIWEDVE